MSDFLVDIKNLRAKLKEAVEKGVFEDNAVGVFEHTILTLVDKAENDRQQLLKKAEQFRNQAIAFENQSIAFNSFKSMAFNMLDSLVKNREKELRALEEEASLQEIPEPPVELHKKSDKK